MGIDRKAGNRKTGLMVAAIPLFFFVAVIVQRIWLS